MGDAEKDGKKEGAKCPKCDSDLHHVEKVDQHYCFSCETYYDEKDVVRRKPKEQPKPVVAEEKKEEEEAVRPKGIPCPACGDMTAPVRDSENYYCYTCEEFYTKGGKKVEKSEKKTEEKVEEKAEASDIVDISEKREEKIEEKKQDIRTESAFAEEESKLTAEETMILDILEGNKGKKADDRKVCPSCGLALTYVQKYDRWYCYTCRKYAATEPSAIKEEKEGEEGMKCAYCGSDAEYVQKYDRYYCRTCKKYLPAERPAKGKEEAEDASTPPLCSQCGKPTTWIPAYERHYCYPCKKYAPKTSTSRAEAKPTEEAPKKEQTAKPRGPACENCGQPTTWIEKYERHYCYPCKKYIPKAEPKTEAKPAASAAKSKPNAPLCPTCNKQTTWIAKYERYYCYPCKKYVPKY